MGLSTSEKVRRFYDQFSGEDKVLILINADPDAIASALAVKRLLWRRVYSVTIAHINVIDRPDNLAFIRLLGANLVPFETLAPSSFNRFVLVDSQPGHSEQFQRVAPSVIIDHHPDTGAKAPFQDIRPRYGATASIMTEYLRSTKIKPTAKLATGLYLAIKTDTQNFERQTSIEDVRAFQYLFKHINRHLARKIEQSDLKLEYLKYFSRALQNMRRRKGRVLVHLGAVTNPDICVVLADFFMRINSVTWSIVSGIWDRKLIVIFRNDGIRKNAGVVAKKGFGFSGSAGGHKSMARAEIPLADLKGHVDPKDEARLMNWIAKQIEKPAKK